MIEKSNCLWKQNLQIPMMNMKSLIQIFRCRPKVSLIGKFNRYLTAAVFVFIKIEMILPFHRLWILFKRIAG